MEDLPENVQRKIQVQLVRDKFLQQIFKDREDIFWPHEPIIMRFYGKYMPKTGKNRFGSIYVTPNYVFFTNARLQSPKTAVKAADASAMVRRKVGALAGDESDSASDVSDVESDLDFMLELDLDCELPVSRKSSTEVDVVIPIQRLEDVPDLIRHHTLTHSVQELQLTTGVFHRLLVLFFVPDSSAISKKQPTKFHALVRYLWLHPVLYVRVQDPSEEEWRRQQEQHLRDSALADTDLVIPDVQIVEKMVAKAEAMLEKNAMLRDKIRQQAESLDRIDEHMVAVSNHLKSIKAELRTIESVKGHVFRMATNVDLLLQRQPKKVDRTLRVPTGERFLVPVLYRQAKRRYLPALIVFDDDHFFLAPPKGTSAEFSVMEGHKHSYESLLQITATFRHQHLKIRFSSGDRTMTVFSSYVQHIANEMKMRSRHDFRLFFHPNARVFDVDRDEIRQVAINVSGDDVGDGKRNAIKTIRAKVNVYDPVIQFQALEQKLGAQAQNEGLQKLREIFALLVEDSGIIQEELLRQTSQLRDQNAKATSQIRQAGETRQRIRNLH